MAQEQKFVAWDFMGLGKMGGVKECGGSKDSGMPLKLHEVQLGQLNGAAIAIDNGILLNNMMDFSGSKHGLRSNAVTFQHLLSSGNSHEEKLIEQSAESAPERSYTPLPQAWWRRDPQIKGSPTVGDDIGPKTEAVAGFGGLLPKDALSLPTSNSLPRYVEAVQRSPESEYTQKKGCASLTIFYGGNVHVFNDIRAETAQAIMFVANTGNLQAMSSPGVANISAINVAMTCANVPSTSAVYKEIPSASVPNINTINLPSRVEMDTQNGSKVEKVQAAPNQLGFGSASMQLNVGHPAAPQSQDQLTVPTALPQARKASLARFLEKRRERVHSKSPYALKMTDSSLPGERFSSSNVTAPHRPHSNTDGKKIISLPSWMERLSEYSSDMVVKEDTQFSSV